MPPASATFSAPPCIMRPSTFRSMSSGKHTMFRAVTTRPPIANTSLSAFAAAICPNVYGSSTIGGKKSSVWIIAVSGDILYTAASSLLSYPTIRLSSALRFGIIPSTLLSAPAPSFAVHPPPLQNSISHFPYLSSFASFI